MTNPTRNLRNEAVDFLYKHGDLTYSAAYADVDKLCSNGFYITRTHTPAPNAGAVKVKPLVWEPVGNPNGRYRLHSTVSWARNTCPYGPYFIGLSSSCKDGEYSWDGPANTGKRGFADPESAKAAAQADYAARILSAIETTPDPRDAVIARMVEAAENLRVKHEYIMRGRTYSMTHMQIVGQFDAALAAAKEVVE